MTKAPYESAAAPTSHSATDPAEFNVVCRSKPNLPNQTDSNAALLPYLIHQLGSAHEWSGVWNGPKLISPFSFTVGSVLHLIWTKNPRLWQLSRSVRRKAVHYHKSPSPRDFSCTSHQNPYFLLKNSFLL